MCGILRELCSYGSSKFITLDILLQIEDRTIWNVEMARESKSIVVSLQQL